MTQLKIQSRPGAAAQAALDPHIGRLYDRPGVRVMAVVELAHIERTQMAPDSDKEASVVMRITHLEVPTSEQEGAVREAQRALYLQRTARGTLDESGQIQLDEETIRLTGGLLHAIDSARMRATASHWADYAARVSNAAKLTESELRHEVRAIADGLRVALDGLDPNGGADHG